MKRITPSSRSSFYVIHIFQAYCQYLSITQLNSTIHPSGFSGFKIVENTVTAVWATALTFRKAAFLAPRERPERLLWAGSQAEDTRDGLLVRSNMLLVERAPKFPSASLGIMKKNIHGKIMISTQKYSYLIRILK